MVFDDDVATGWSLPAPPGRGALAAVVGAIVVVGGVLTTLLWHDADTRAARDERVTAARVADRLETEVRVIDAALANAPLVVWSTHDPLGADAHARFLQFADQLLAHTSMRAIAFEPVVTNADRVVFETRTGVEIRDRTGDTWTPAGRRPTYAPVLWIEPATDATTSIVGFDIAAEPLRGAAAAAAVESGDVELTQPVPSRPSGVASVFVVRALVDRGVTVGWMSTAVTADVFSSALDQVVPGGTAVTVADDGVLLFGDERPTGTRVQTRVGSRTWDVWVDRPD